MNEHKASQEYLESAISQINDGINDLLNWSIYSKDRGINEIHDFRQKFNELAEELKK